MQTLEFIFSKLVEYEADRSSYIVGIGGGIVCDVTGFAASIFMRGVRFGFVSTTLLSMVDASVGGKNGVNFNRYKNMIGVFNQPDFVICDIGMLQTLPKNELHAGFAEIVKAGAIKDDALFAYMEQHADTAVHLNQEVIEHVVYESVMIKAKVVEEDEKEKGERRKLNFGHTFGHAFEKLTDLLHGEAVSIGMVLAAELSARLGYLTNKDVQRIVDLLVQLQLPVETDLDMQKVFQAMKQDKKREGESIHLVLLESIGKAITKKLTYTKLEEIVYDLRSYIRYGL
jgi:3-dehydroquinate synthase